jgi:hypothetical protein
MEILDTFMKGNEFPVIPILVAKKTGLDKFYQELETKLNVYQGKEIKRLNVEPKDYDKLYQWLKNNINNPSNVSFDEETGEMMIEISMDGAQYERYLENFVIKRVDKKRQDRGW